MGDLPQGPTRELQTVLGFTIIETHLPWNDLVWQGSRQRPSCRYLLLSNPSS